MRLTCVGTWFDGRRRVVKNRQFKGKCGGAVRQNGFSKIEDGLVFFNGGLFAQKYKQG